MNDIQLHATTGRDVVDGALRATIGALDAAFPGRICGYYIEGSYADGMEMAASDVDLVVVFKGACDDTERARAAAVSNSCDPNGGVELDIMVVDEAELARGAYPTLKLGSQCVYGEDIRDSLALLPIEEWTRQRMHAAYTLVVRVFDRPVPVRYPLGYPDPQGDYYGYDNRTVRLPNGRDVPSTRNLIRVTGWAATALLARRASVYVARKSACHDTVGKCAFGPLCLLNLRLTPCRLSARIGPAQGFTNSILSRGLPPAHRRRVDGCIG